MHPPPPKGAPGLPQRSKQGWKYTEAADRVCGHALCVGAVADEVVDGYAQPVPKLELQHVDGNHAGGQQPTTGSATRLDSGRLAR